MVKFWAISYFIARLAMVLEISKLAILRFRPRARVIQIARHERTHTDGTWLCSPQKDYYVNLSTSPNKPCIIPLPEKVMN